MSCVRTYQSFRLQSSRLTATNWSGLPENDFPCNICFLSFLSGGFSLKETFVFAERSYLLLLSIAPSHNFWWSPSHRWGKHKSSRCNTAYYSISLSWPTVFVQTGWVYFSQSNFNISERNAMLVLVFCWSLKCWWGNHIAQCPLQR